jgi:hypothetical protein
MFTLPPSPHRGWPWEQCGCPPRAIVYQVPQTTGVVSFQLPQYPKLTVFPMCRGSRQVCHQWRNFQIGGKCGIASNRHMLYILGLWSQISTSFVIYLVVLVIQVFLGIFFELCLLFSPGMMISPWTSRALRGNRGCSPPVTSFIRLYMVFEGIVGASSWGGLWGLEWYDYPSGSLNFLSRWVLFNPPFGECNETMFFLWGHIKQFRNIVLDTSNMSELWWSKCLGQLVTLEINCDRQEIFEFLPCPILSMASMGG